MVFRTKKSRFARLPFKAAAELAALVEVPDSAIGGSFKCRPVCSQETRSPTTQRGQHRLIPSSNSMLLAAPRYIKVIVVPLRAIVLYHAHHRKTTASDRPGFESPQTHRAMSGSHSDMSFQVCAVAGPRYSGARTAFIKFRLQGAAWMVASVHASVSAEIRQSAPQPCNISMPRQRYCHARSDLGDVAPKLAALGDTEKRI